MTTGSSGQPSGERRPQKEGLGESGSGETGSGEIRAGEIRAGGCHCGTVRFRFTMPENPIIRRCNCTICAMKGVVMLDVPMTALTITAGEDALTLYTFGSGDAKHRFCSHCGIHPFHQLRSEPDHYGLNLACVDGLSIYDLPEVPVFDGQSHPADGNRYAYAGVMRFERHPRG